MARILVTGGAGYVGSHLVRVLSENGHEPVVLDDLSTGHRAAVGDAPLIVGDCGNRTLVDAALREHAIEFVAHLAAKSEVGASQRDPAGYYSTNVIGSLRLLESARRHRVRGIVFSSSAAVYGEPSTLPIDEEHPQRPTNVYGRTKWVIERALEDHHSAYGMRFASLRYFNAAGAHPDGTIGEDHEPESHLLPRLLRAAVGGSQQVPIFGMDYPTRDGTCERDYVHVMDLAQAHLLALERLAGTDANPGAFNLGNERGFTVLEVLRAVERVTGRSIGVQPAPRRDGDPAVLVAGAARAKRELGWRPRWSSLDSMVGTAWDWHRARPDGFAEARWAMGGVSR